jgi:hypothetical protein
MAADQFSGPAIPVQPALLAGDWQASVQPVHWGWYGGVGRWYGGYRPYYGVAPGYSYYSAPYTTYYGGVVPYSTYSYGAYPYSYGAYPYYGHYWGRPWAWRRW